VEQIYFQKIHKSVGNGTFNFSLIVSIEPMLGYWEAIKSRQGCRFRHGHEQMFRCVKSTVNKTTQNNRKQLVAVIVPDILNTLCNNTKGSLLNCISCLLFSFEELNNAIKFEIYWFLICSCVVMIHLHFPYTTVQSFLQIIYFSLSSIIVGIEFACNIYWYLLYYIHKHVDFFLYQATFTNINRILEELL
jgi:hypothetical protein